MTKYSFCNNCGKQGHLYHQCKRPITSIGIVCFRLVTGQKREYLLICRKNSLGYVDFMRGKYPLSNKIYLKNIIYEMTNDENYIHKFPRTQHLINLGGATRDDLIVSRNDYQLLMTNSLIRTIKKDRYYVNIEDTCDNLTILISVGFPYTD